MIYVVVLLLMVLLRVLMPQDTKENRRTFAIVSFLALFLVSALRAPEVGRDTASFLAIFSKLHGRSFFDIFTYSTWVEPGFRLLLATVALFTSNGQWVIVVTSFLIHGSVSLFLYRHSKNVYLSFFLYMAMMIYPFYLNIMRQALAVAVLLFAWDCLKRRRWIGYLLLVLLAASFHVSALLFLPCPLLTLIPVNKRTLRVILPVTGGLAVTGLLLVRPLVSLVTLLIPRYADYTPTTFLALYGFFAVFLACTGFGVYRLYFARDAAEVLSDGENEKGGFDEKGFLTLMMLLGCVVAAMMTGFGQLQRVFNYFEVLYLLYLPMILRPVYYHKEKRHLAVSVETGVALGLAVVYFWWILFFRSALWYDALPYRLFWQ